MTRWTSFRKRARALVEFLADRSGSASGRLARPAWRDRALAVAIAIGLGALGYASGLRWYFVALDRVDARIADLEASRERYRRQIGALPAQLEALERERGWQSESPYVLREANANLAAAELIRRVRALAEETAPNDQRCHVTSADAQAPGDGGAPSAPFRRVSVRVHMECAIRGLRDVLHKLESGRPFVRIESADFVRTSRTEIRGLPVPAQIGAQLTIYGFVSAENPAARSEPASGPGEGAEP